MNGDFSQWRPFDPNENFNGVLHQQGRVLIDPDWNDQARIVDHWQGRAGKDVIGEGIAAVPVGSNGFKIEAAEVVNVGGSERVELDVRPGHAWADGLLVYLGGDPAATVKRVATYLGPPIQNPPHGFFDRRRRARRGDSRSEPRGVQRVSMAGAIDRAGARRAGHDRDEFTRRPRSDCFASRRTKTATTFAAS